MAEFTKEQLVGWANTLIEETNTDISIPRTDAHAESYRAQLELLEIALAALTAPQLPQPAVPDELSGKSFEYIANKFQVSMSESQWILVGWNACRAAMLQGAEPVQQWIPCSERMPENSDAVLVCQEGGITFCAEYDGGEFYPDEFPNLPKKGKEITHWMPLPAAPQQEVE